MPGSGRAHPFPGNRQSLDSGAPCRGHVPRHPGHHRPLSPGALAPHAAPCPALHGRRQLRRQCGTEAPGQRATGWWLRPSRRPADQRREGGSSDPAGDQARRRTGDLRRLPPRDGLGRHRRARGSGPSAARRSDPRRDPRLHRLPADGHHHRRHIRLTGRQGKKQVGLFARLAAICRAGQWFARGHCDSLRETPTFSCLPPCAGPHGGSSSRNTDQP